MTQCVYNYTNHTVLPEALEKWTVALIEKVHEKKKFTKKKEKWTVTLIEKVHYQLKASHIRSLRPHTLVA